MSGGNDDRVDSAEFEVDEGTELMSESSEGVVGHVCEEMKVTYNGVGHW